MWPFLFYLYPAAALVLAPSLAYRAIRVHRCHAPTVVCAAIWGTLLGAICYLVGLFLLGAAISGFSGV